MKILILNLIFTVSILDLARSKLVDLNGKTYDYFTDVEYKTFYKKIIKIIDKKPNIFENSSFYKLDSPDNDTIITYYTGHLWEKSSVTYRKNNLKIIDLFYTDSLKSCTNKLKWLIHDVKDIIYPSFLYEIRLEESIAIKCPYTCMNSSLNETKNIKYEWFKVKYGSIHFKPVEYSDRVYLDKNFTLYIKNFLESDSGSYYCIGNTMNISTPIYFDLILKFPIDKRENVIAPSFNFIMAYFNQSNIKYSFIPNDYLEKGYYKDNENEIFIQPMWTEWSVCGDCNKKSIRSKTGDCLINSNDSSNQELSYLQRIYYPNGGPCYLKVFYEYLSDETLTRDIFKNYNYYESCYVNCAEYQFENDLKLKDQLFDEDLIYEEASSSAEKEANLKINKLERYKGDNVKLACLDYKFENEIEWKKNDVKLKKESNIYNKSNFINEFNEYEINSLRLMDSGVYKCFYKNRLVAIIELVVLSKISISKITNEDSYEIYAEFLFEIMLNVTFLVIISMIFKYVNVQLIKMRIKKKQNL